MHTYVFEGRMTALSSISHNGGQSFGISSKLRRERFVQVDGSVEDVPVLSGNGLRGVLRDRGMLHMCRSLGYGTNQETGEVIGLPLAAFHFLFSGGSLTSTGSRGIDIDAARTLKRLIPLVGVFGGAVGNNIMPGKLRCGKALPICLETMHLLPEQFATMATTSIWDYVQEEMYTRKDDEKNEQKRALIAPGIRKMLDDERLAKALRKNQGDDRQDDIGQHQQMRYYVETLAAGTAFYWRLELDDVTDLEFDAFITTLVEFSKAPYVGGKANVGLGHVAITFDRWLSIDSRVQAETNAVALPAGAPYQLHLRERGDAIRQLLAGMQ